MHKKPKNMHKIDYEKLISIKRDVGWFEAKKEILFEGWPRLYTGVQKKGSKEDRHSMLPVVEL